MDLSHGGHLTHGAPVSHMGRVFNFIRYRTDPANKGAIDFDALLAQAREHRPKMILCGYSSYPRDYDYREFKRVADDVGALTMADVSHIGGLIAGNAMANPLDHGFDVMTTTGHKTLRGPRSGLILSRAEHRRKIDKAVFPGLQGGPHMNAVAALAITLGKALEPEFAVYARQVLSNAKVLADELMSRAAELVTGGTENHMMVLDTQESFGIDGRVAEETLDKVSITVNKQLIPDDPLPPLRPSGIRLGSPAATTRGMEEAEMKLLAEWIMDALRRHRDEERLDAMRQDIERFCLRFPVPGVTPPNAGAASPRRSSAARP